MVKLLLRIDGRAGLGTNPLIQNIMLFVKIKATMSQLLPDDEELLLLFFI
jgi:hypothetical protein